MESRGKKPAKPSGSQSDRIRTLSDLNRRSAPDSDSDSDGPQEHFTGGEKSGMLVQDPVEGPPENLRPSSSSRGDTVPSEPQQPGNFIHYIVFWADGFTVDSGPLRKLDDPENASFLESIRNSECPKELEPADRRSPVHVNLISRDEEFPANEKPEKRLEIACQGVPFQGVPFQGVGRTIGSSSTSTVAEPPAASSLNTAPTPSPGLFVDENLPLASIRLRLADGTVMENARFNFHHTINDIHAYINAARPGGAKNYHLQLMGFPAKRLTDLSQTIEQAGLDKAVVIQKF